MLNHLKDDESEFSFKKIIPMPEELQGTRSPARIISEAEYKKEQYEKNFKEEEHPHFRDKGAITKKMSDDWKERFGADNWYDWTTNNWGTKWGAYDVEVGEMESLPAREGFVKVVIRFQTAWSSGAVAIAKLAEVYPTIEFYLIYADEDCGFNTGKIWWENGFTANTEIPKESMENYFECWGQSDDWELVDGEWKWNEDE